MLNYKCPYCDKGFKSWLSVRGHVSTCPLNDKSYMICTYYGPISINTYNSYKSIEDFRKSYPLITFGPYQWQRLRIDNKSSLREHVHTKQYAIETLQAFYKEHGRIPQAREFYSRLDINKQAIVNLFGSWNTAIEESGFEADYNDGFGKRTIAKDGILYRSKTEAYFVDHFLFEKEEYEYEKPYGNGWLFDFYLPKYNIYIEIDGGLRPERTKEKIEFCNKNQINLKVFTKDEVYSISSLTL